MNIGEKIQLNKAQAAIVFGHPLQSIQPGLHSNYAGMDVEIVGVDENNIEIKRVAFDAFREDTPTSSTDNKLNPLDAFNDGAPQDTSNSGGGATKTGLIDKKTLQPGLNPGGDTTEKVDVLGPELKMPHPPGWFTNIPINEEPMRRHYSDAMLMLLTLQEAQKRDGINPIISVKE